VESSREFIAKSQKENLLVSNNEDFAFSIVIPVYNEEEGVELTLDNLQKNLVGCPYSHEVIVVNDGSIDNSREILRSRQDIRLIEHYKNRGYGAALKTGMKNAKYPLIVITDGDGTYPNERIPQLVSLMENADMVVGARIGANVQYSNLRKIPKIFLVAFAQWVTNTKIPDLNSGLRVFRRDVALRFVRILSDGFSFTTTITVAMLINDYQVHYEPIDYSHRKGKSKIKPIRDTLRFVQIILRTGIYFAPLRIFMPIAGIFFMGFLITLYQDIFIDQNLDKS